MIACLAKIISYLEMEFIRNSGKPNRERERDEYRRKYQILENSREAAAAIRRRGFVCYLQRFDAL